MQAVIMAGGKGTRLASVTKDEIPKPMVPIAGKPLLLWQIEECRRNGIRDVIFITGHLGEQIEAFFRDGSSYGMHISYIREQTPLGTAGSFYALKRLLTEPYFLLVFGDVLFAVDCGRMAAFHKSHGAKATLLVHPNGHPYDSDLVVLDDRQKVRAFLSKSRHETRNGWYDNCVNAGCYVLDRSICDLVPKQTKTDLEKDLLAPLAEQGGDIYGYRSFEYIKDIGTVERIRQAEAELADGRIWDKCFDRKQKCIFLDRDGTLNVYRGLLWKEEDLELEQGAAEAVRRINASGYLCILVTNQPVVARGLCSAADVETIHKKLATLLGREGAYLDGMYYCPHHPDRGYPGENPAYKIPCGCRKPGIGMLQKAAEEYHIDLSQSWIVGDTTTDICTGIQAGMHTALVRTGEAGKDGKYAVQPDLTGEHLTDVVEQILKL